MNTIVSAAVTALFFLILCLAYWYLVIDRPRRQVKDPKEGKATMFEVRRLLQEGDREAAIRLYIRIFKVSAKQARKDVEDLQRNLKV